MLPPKKPFAFSAGSQEQSPAVPFHSWVSRENENMQIAILVAVLPGGNF